MGVVIILSMQWSVELLGGFRVRAEGQVVTRFRTHRAALLLAYLCLHPRQHSRDELADRFWSEVDIDSARASLRQALSQIRQALRSAQLIPETLLHLVGNSSVGVHAENMECDVALFRQALGQKQVAQARLLYGGPLLPGFWDEWVVEERDQLEELYLGLPELPESGSGFVARLPVELNRFFGRQEESAALRALLLPGSGNRVVTLLGPGGMGKTRLSLTVAQGLLTPYHQRVCFVPLAGLTDSRLLLNTIREALGIVAHASADPVEQIADLAQDAPFLLVLDNLEELASTVSASLARLLSHAPTLTCLMTSRRRLGVPGERQLTLSALNADESMHLFCDRAGVHPREEIQTLCQLLEGIPLAIELAAARVGTLTITEMITKIGERRELLSTTQTNKSLRHRSLHAAIDWSIRLLTADQRRFFAGLSIFRGGWTTEAAIYVCEEPSALEYLSQLRDRSLVSSEEDTAGLRWTMLESLREFGEELLTKGEWERLVVRHGQWFTELVVKHDEDILRSQESQQWLGKEKGNFHLALSLLAPERGLVLCSYLVNFWTICGQVQELFHWLPYFYGVATPELCDRLRLLVRGASAWGNLGHKIENRIWIDEALALARKVGTNRDVIHALRRKADLCNETNQFDEALHALDEATSLVGNEGDTLLLGECHASSGWLFFQQKKGEKALYHLETALQIFIESGAFQMINICQHRLSMVLGLLGRYEKALLVNQKNIQSYIDSGSEQYLNVSYIVRMSILIESGKIDDAIEYIYSPLNYSVVNKNYHFSRACFAYVSSIYKSRECFYYSGMATGFYNTASILSGLPLADQDLEMAVVVAALRKALGDEAFETSVAQGRAMALEEAQAFVQSTLLSPTT